MQVGSRRTETKDLNSSSVSPSALVSFPSLSVTWLLYPFVFENMATGAYKFHTFELSWMNNNMMTFSVQVERNLQKILRISLGQMISYYHVGYSGGGWGAFSNIPEVTGIRGEKTLLVNGKAEQKVSCLHGMSEEREGPHLN